eukprot:3338508-Prymnesium_polylepis.1
MVVPDVPSHCLPRLASCAACRAASLASRAATASAAAAARRCASRSPRFARSCSNSAGSLPSTHSVLTSLSSRTPNARFAARSLSNASPSYEGAVRGGGILVLAKCCCWRGGKWVCSA